MLLARARPARAASSTAAGYGADTLSTHALMRGGVLQLHRWGLLDDVVAAGTPPVRRTTFRYADDVHRRSTIKPSHGVDALYAPRRTVLDPILVDAAAAAGAEVLLRRHRHRRRRATPRRGHRDRGPRPVSAAVRVPAPASSSAPTASGRRSPSWRRRDERVGTRRQRVDLRLLGRPRDRRLRVGLPPGAAPA